MVQLCKSPSGAIAGSAEAPVWSGYSAWLDGQPHEDEAKRLVQHCVKVVEDKWTNAECDKLFVYACEKPVVPVTTTLGPAASTVSSTTAGSTTTAGDH
jgi:hypothetical protein